MTTVTTSDSIELYAESSGTGEAILFIHEYAADHRTWAGQVAELSGEFRCITYSSRGYPPSQVPLEQERYSHIRQADDAIDVLDAFGVDRAHVVGLSMGGFCALQLGIRYPDRVRSLFVSSAGSGADPAHRATFITETDQVAAAYRRLGAAALAERMGVGPSRIQLQRKDPAAWQVFVDHLSEHSAEGMALTIVGIQQRRPSLYDITDDLRRITAPTLVVNGDEDEACLEPGLLLKRTIASAGLLVIPNSGHALNLEEPRLYNTTVRDFIHAVQRGLWPSRDERSLDAGMGVRDPASET